MVGEPLHNFAGSSIYSQRSVGTRATDLPAIIQKEALYCAVGRCAIRLKDTIPFEEWLEKSLMAEAQETHPRSVIIEGITRQSADQATSAILSSKDESHGY